MKAYTNKMLSDNETFTQTLDLEEDKRSWTKVFDCVIGEKAYDFDKIKKRIHYSKVIGQERQREDILERFGLRHERSKERIVREAADHHMGFTYKRFQKMPFYNISLTEDQYNKLFYDKPFRDHRKSPRKSPRGQAGGTRTRQEQESLK